MNSRRSNTRVRIALEEVRDLMARVKKESSLMVTVEQFQRRVRNLQRALYNADNARSTMMCAPHKANTASVPIDAELVDFKAQHVDPYFRQWEKVLRGVMYIPDPTPNEAQIIRYLWAYASWVVNTTTGKNIYEQLGDVTHALEVFYERRSGETLMPRGRVFHSIREVSDAFNVSYRVARDMLQDPRSKVRVIKVAGKTVYVFPK